MAKVHSKLPQHVEVVEAVGGRWIILINGFQWGTPDAKIDASGAYDTTFATREEAEASYLAISR